MEALQQLIPLLITISLAGLVLAVGLHASRGDLTYVLKRPALLVKAIIAVDVIPPIAAGVMVAFLPLEPAVKAGILLMAIAPVPPLVPGKELAIGGRKDYAYGLYVAMALLTIVSAPLVFTIAARAFGRDDHFSMAQVAATVISGVIVPLLLGVAIKRFAPKLAEQCWSIVYKISMVLVLAAFLPVLMKAWPAIVAMTGNGTVLAMTAVIAVTIVGGHLLGGPDLNGRATLAIASSVRHPGIAMGIASANFADPRVSAAILLFMVIGMIVSIPYARWIKRHSGDSAPHGVPSPSR